VAFWVTTLTIFALSFMFFWGAAPCWHFERLWRERHGASPSREMLIGVGLAPSERRRASVLVFILIGALVAGASAAIGSFEFARFGAGILSGLCAGLVLGLGLHYFGPGKDRIAKFFDVIDNNNRP
jgi:hypothetical protein